MKSLILFLIVAFIGFAQANSPLQTPSLPNSGKILVKIEGFDNNQGQAMIALHNTKKTFLKKAEPFRRAILPIEGSTITHSFEDIPHGEYSIAVFQDDNKNMDLDLGKMFIPKEKFGFSNNPSSKYGPPGYKKTTFQLDSELKEISVSLSKITF
jgi:uncharacterized protein (DUF2141 family)